MKSKRGFAATFGGRVAVVTGAASGIGRALATTLARANARLAISDIDADGLNETAGTCRDFGAEVHQAPLDVADRVAVFAYADTVAAHYGAVHLVINNAGVALAGDIADLTIADMKWLMDINYWGVVYGTKAFLPHLQRADWGHIVNLSSVFGLIAFPGQGAYNATKFAVRGFTECLAVELAAAGSHIAATSVHPGVYAPILFAMPAVTIPTNTSC